MAKVYIENIPSSSYLRTVWDGTGGTNYVINDRVSLSDSTFVRFGGTVDDSKNRIYVCVNNNNSTDYPFNSNDWVLAGSSEEYPCYAVDGSINTNNLNNEVYLEFEADRYKGYGSNRFTWRQATADGTENGELIFGDGEYHDNGKGFSINLLSFTAKNPGKVTISTVGNYQFIFQGNNSTPVIPGLSRDVARMTGVKFLVSGSKNLISANQIIGFYSCVITDTGAGGGQYNRSSFTLGDNGQFLELKHTLLDLRNTTVNLIGNSAALHNGKKAVWENCTFYTSAGTTANQTPLFYGGTNNIIVKKCIFAFTTTQYTTNNWTLGLAPGSSENLIHCYDQSVAQPAGETAAILKDPLFIDRQNSNFELRPSSSCIESNNIQLNEKDKLEAEYPQGVWFDSNASAGGNGSWASPYNDYDDIIDLATGDQLAILVKKGIHPLKQGFKLLSPGNARWNSDLPKKFTDGIIFAGLGDESIFSTDTLGSRPFGGLLNQANSLKPNSYDTPFTFKDLKISISGSSTITKGLIQVSNLTLKKVLIQHTSPGSISSSLFESYTFTTDPNLTLNIDSCQISASLQGSTLLFGSIYKKHIINSTFVDLDSKPTGETTPATYSSSGQNKNSHIENCIFYTKSTVSSGAITPGFNDSSWTLKNVNFYSEHYDWSSILTNNAIKENVQVNPPGFISPEPSSLDLRLRPDSLLIGGVDRKAYKSNAVWIQTGSGTGTGTESDPFYFDQFSDAVLEAVNNTSFELVLKDGTYIFSTAGAELADSNLSLVTLIAENKHDAIITDNGAAISISGLPSNQALNIKNIKLISDAQFVSNTAIDLNANSCLFVIQDSMNFPNVNIDQSILEVKLGFNTSQINSSNGAITNCVFIDKNPGATITNKVNVAGSINFKNCIFWSEVARSVDPANGTFKSCASYNYTVAVNATDIIHDGDPGFINLNNSNYNLRPNSALIGKGK